MTLLSNVNAADLKIKFRGAREILPPVLPFFLNYLQFVGTFNPLSLSTMIEPVGQYAAHRLHTWQS
jgi:hypothetical protein